MNKDFLDKIENTNNELERLKQRLQKIENKECIVIKDSGTYYINNYFVVKNGRIEERKVED